MRDLPTGTITFVFTDIEGSTRLLQELGDDFATVLERHHALLREMIDRHAGIVVTTEGDSFFAVFREPLAAIRAAADAQHALAAEPWPANIELRVRMGLHTGQGVLGGDNYVGLDVHRAARIAAAGHGGQVLLSDSTRSLTEASLPAGLELRDLGQHRLKDLPRAEHIFQLVVDGLPADFPHIRSLDSRPNNLPAPITSFIGREQQIAEISRLLGDSRLLTLTGPGGTGKTRLGIRVAEELLSSFEHGAWFVALDALRDPALLPSAIADALGVKPAGGQSAGAALTAWLADRELLLVLDNFEQLIEGAPVVSELLNSAPRLRVLATSRVPLHLYGEREFAVPPLGGATTALREAARTTSATQAEQISQYEAVQLFIERAVAVRSDFRVTNSNAPAVAELCARLDGLPLAIELAAARIKLLTPEQILARLGASISLLASTAQDLPERQRTLRGAIDWSYDLLDDAEQRLFGRLALFHVGFTLESAEQVCAAGLDGDVFDGLASLVDKSLLRSIEAGQDTRFVMLETIREYAAERLAGTPDEADTARRHAAHYFELAIASEPHLTGSEQISWLDRLEQEHPNLRAAFDRAPALGMLDQALLAAGAIWRFWHQRAHFAEARAIFDRLLELPGAGDAARAKALIGAGGIAYWQNDIETTEAWYREAAELYEKVGDPAGIAEAAYNLGYMPLLRGDFAEATRLAERSVAMYGQVGDEMGLAGAEALLSYAYLYGGDLKGAMATLEKSVARYRRLGARFQLADTGGGLGYLYAVVGDWPRAMELIRESFAIMRETGYQVGVAMVLEVGASLAAVVGEYERSARLFGAADALKERLGGGVPAALAQTESEREHARTELGSARFDELHAAGGGLPEDQAIGLFETFEPPRDAPPAPVPIPG